jgi:CRP-like cAMP-binding protein
MPRKRGKAVDGDGVTGDGDGDGEESTNNPSYDTFEQDFDSADKDSADEDGVSASPPSPRQKVDRAKMNNFLQKTIFGAGVDDLIEEGTNHASELEYMKKWCGLLHPDTPIRAFYDFVQLSILLYLAWVLPNRLAFSKIPKGLEIIGDLFIDTMVWVDIFLSMHMYFYDSKTKQLVTNQVRIKKSYLNSWFLIDLFSVLPVDQLLLITGNLMIEHGNEDVAGIGFEVAASAAAARMLRLIRLVRLARLAKLLNIDKIVMTLYVLLKTFGVTRLQLMFYFRVIFLIFVMLGGAHLLGCLWLMIGRYNALEEVTPVGWMISAYGVMDENGLNMNKTRDFICCISEDFVDKEWNEVHGSSCVGDACDPVPPHAPYDVDCAWIQDKRVVEGAIGEGFNIGAAESSQYLTAFYFSLVTLSTVGYGDISPDTPLEKKFVVFSIMVGAFMYAYIIGEFSDLISNIKKEKSLFDAKMRSVNDLLAYIDSPLELRSKVQDFYEFKFQNKEGVDFVNELPIAMQTQIVKHRWGSLISRVPFFKGLKDGTIVELCKRMTKFMVSPGDLIMEVGEHHDELLILSKGQAETEADSDGHKTDFDPGTFWGELQFLGLEEERTLTVKATIFCEVASLAPRDIQDILLAHDGLRQRFESYGAMRKEIEDKIAHGIPFDIDELMQQLEKRYAESQDDGVKRMNPKKRIMNTTNDQIMEAVTKLQGNVEMEIATVNDRMDMIEAHLERAVTSMKKLEEQSVTEVHAACENLGEQLIKNFQKRKRGVPLSIIPGIS